MEIFEGQSITARVAFTTVTGIAMDPTTIALFVRPPEGAVVTYSNPFRVEQGVYSQDLVLSTPGRWYFRWEGSGALRAVVEGYLDVAESRVV